MSSPYDRPNSEISWKEYNKYVGWKMCVPYYIAYGYSTNEVLKLCPEAYKKLANSYLESQRIS